MKKLKYRALALVLVTAIACFLSQSCGSGDRNATGGSTNLAAKPKSEFIANDPDWDVSVTSASQTAGSAVSCAPAMRCWLWNASSLWAYDQQHQATRITVELNENEQILNAFLLSERIGWIVSSRGLFKTRDGGSNWTQLKTPQFDGDHGRIHAVYFNNEEQGWIAGGRYQLPFKGETLPNNALSDDRKRVLIGAVSKTTDGGITWQDTSAERSAGRFTKITFSGAFGMVSGDAGLQVSRNSGADWRDTLSDLPRSEAGERREVRDAFLLDDQLGWATLSGSTLIRTENGARSWQVIYPSEKVGPDAVSFNEIVFVDGRRGLALYTHTGRGQLYKTDDAGRSWSRIVTEESFSALGGVSGSKLVMAVGKGGIYSFSPKAER
ncbi:MAG TPA: hypothetical protein VNO50_05970 [Pyrinomonadaceae bacterium]|nr:hypothetical protein [Pyrinomonadaceae bacterium]